MFQVVRTVLQEERRDPGVPTPKARQVFTLLWSQSFGPYHIFNYFRKLDEIVNCDTNTICKIKMENIAFEMDESGMF